MSRESNILRCILARSGCQSIVTNNYAGDEENSKQETHFIDLIIEELNQYSNHDARQQIIGSIKKQHRELAQNFESDELYYEALAAIYRYLRNFHAYLCLQIDRNNLNVNPVGLAAVLIKQFDADLYENNDDEIKNFQPLVQAVPREIMEWVSIYIKCVVDEIFEIFPGGSLPFFPTPKPINLLEMIAVETVIYKRSTDELNQQAVEYNLRLRSSSTTSNPEVKAQVLKPGHRFSLPTMPLPSMQQTVENMHAFYQHHPERIFESLFDEIARFNPAEFNKDAIASINQQLTELCVTHELSEFRVDKLTLLYHYFSNLYAYLDAAVNNAQQQGVVYELSQKLIKQADKLVKKDCNGALDDLVLYAASIPQGVIERLRIYAELVSGEIYKKLKKVETPTIDFCITDKTLSPLQQAAFMKVASERTAHELTELAKAYQSKTSKSSSPSPAVRQAIAGRRTSTPPLLCSLASSRLPSLTGSPVPTALLSWCDKWQHLSSRQKWLFGTLIAIEIIGIVALSIFVPGSPLVTIPGLGTLNANVLAITLGAAAMVVTAHRIHHKVKKVEAMSYTGKFGSNQEGSQYARPSCFM